jgi:hypothetical protein
VCIQGFDSRKIIVHSGVPQGSHVGPVLFNIFANTVCSVLENCQYLLYADDLKIFRKVCNIYDAQKLQSDLSAVVDWCTVNKMELNAEKCKIVSFTRKTINNRVKYDYEINNVMSLLKSLFCSIVRPRLEYCSVIWDPFTQIQINLIESVQKQFLLFALKGLGWNDPFILPSYESRLMLLNMDTLKNRRSLATASFMYKLTNGEIDAPELKDLLTANQSRYDTRNRPVLMSSSHSTNYGKNNPINRMVNVFNSHSNIFLSSPSRPRSRKHYNVLTKISCFYASGFHEHAVYEQNTKIK